MSQKKMTQEALDNLQAAVREIQEARLPIAIIYLQQGKFAEAERELAEFFRRAQGESRKGAEQGKELLRSRLCA